MMVTREAPGHYRVTFEQPLNSQHATGDRDADEREILEAYVARLVPFVARYPEQFTEWHSPRRWLLETGSAAD